MRTKKYAYISQYFAVFRCVLVLVDFISIVQGFVFYKVTSLTMEQSYVIALISL